MSADSEMQAERGSVPTGPERGRLPAIRLKRLDAACRARRARHARGGTLRFHAALVAALAVTALPAFLVTTLSAVPTASARVSHLSVSTTPVPSASVPGAPVPTDSARSRPVAPRIDLMSYAEAEKVSRFVTYTEAVTLSEEEAYLRYVAFMTYLQEQAYLKAVAQAAQQQAAARAAATPSRVGPPAAPQPAGSAGSTSGIPAAWLPTALCEEGGRNDPVAGYFGILEWNGFDGYPTAGSAPLSVQLAWEATFIGAPPDAPGQCHSY